tara:strand:- start:452 stop:1456 length:1005 start_codon:yes stop_codon:yes gene_type:complete
MAKSKIFVTGAEGFIGSHLVEALLKKGYSVKALVLYNFRGDYGLLNDIDDKLKKKLEVILGDIRDYDFILSATKDCDLIFHLAALIGIPYSYISPESYLKTNVEGSLNIFRAALRNNVKQVVNTSTSEVYGTAKTIPIKETHILNGQSPYAASKISSDQFANSFYLSFGLPVTTIRPFNTFGPRQSLRAVIPTIISQSLVSKYIKLGNINSSRDLTFIDDTVNGFISSINNKISFGKFINLGTNSEISIKKIVSLISNILGKDLKIKLDKKRIRPKNSEVDRLIASNNLAKKILKWKPKYSSKSGLISALQKTVNWYQDNQKKIDTNNNNKYII